MTLPLSPRPTLGRALTRAGSATAAAAFVVASIATPMALGLLCLSFMHRSDGALRDLTEGAAATFATCATLFVIGITTLALGMMMARRTHADAR